jgi:hypothetical protein
MYALILGLLLFPILRIVVKFLEKKIDIYTRLSPPRTEYDYAQYFFGRKILKASLRRWSAILSIVIISVVLVFYQRGDSFCEPREKEAATMNLTGSVLGQSLRHCTVRGQSGEYCYYKEEWQNGDITREREEERFYYVDQFEEIYFRLNTVRRQLIGEGEDYEIINGHSIVKEKSLKRTLKRLYEKEGERCICPGFLGIRDNISFLYYHEKSDWIILNNPVLGERLTNSQLVNTWINYPQNSVFRKFLSSDQSQKKNEHYDSFTLSFDSPSYQFDSQDVRLLEEYNAKMFHYETVKMGDAQQNVFILRRLSREKHIKRLSIKLKGQDAVCFIFCQRLSFS